MGSSPLIAVAVVASLFTRIVHAQDDTLPSSIGSAYVQSLTVSATGIVSAVPTSLIVISLSTSDGARPQTLVSSLTSSSTSTSTTQSSNPRTSATASATISTSQNPETVATPSGHPPLFAALPLIIGLVVGLVVLAGIIAGVWMWVRSRRRQRRPASEQEKHEQHGQAEYRETTIMPPAQPMASQDKMPIVRAEAHQG